MIKWGSGRKHRLSMKKALSSIPSGGKQGKKEGKKELRAGGRGRGRVEIVREGDRVEITKNNATKKEE